MDFSTVESCVNRLQTILDELKSLCGPDFIDGTNINWNIIINLIDRDKTSLGEFITYIKNNTNQLSDIRRKIKQGCD